MTLPNFFIVGAPKAGTTSAYHYLRQHPEVFMSPLKEPHYFAQEVREERMEAQLRSLYRANTRDLADFLNSPDGQVRHSGIVESREQYQRLFDGAGSARAIGEASVGYLHSKTAPEEIARCIPDARIVMLLRHPAERAYSQYLFGVASGMIRWSFREQIERNLHNRSTEICSHYPFLEFGYYADPVKRYRDLFGDRVWIGLHHEYRDRPAALCRELFSFLGVDASFQPAVGQRYRQARIPIQPAAWLKQTGAWNIASRWVPERARPVLRSLLLRPAGSHGMAPADRKYLVDLYREDVLRLSRRLNRDLSAWLV